MERTLVIIIKKRDGMISRETVGDKDLEQEERRFVFRDIEEAARKANVI